MNFDRPFFTSPLALTDMHAEGEFFALMFRECLRFESGGRVRWWREVVESSLPRWDNLDEFCKHTMVGTYQRNDRGQLVCKFPNMEFTGLQCEDADNLLVFHVWFPLSQEHESRIFHLQQSVHANADRRSQGRVDRRNTA